ncbi:sugar kinase [Meiothermus ruber]|jgi:2-dehydro-3-deoxygluconokinase|uniref:PfkB domain protein n=2 Tax=Meiothermus ruber TaxID=277 RepID=D3PLU2_MEIRD|nr:sugar kinase [Meiothermus ruber]ADD27053.1 PfkB domain protein [Meiothermus ruber DSM 1279]AGK03508.1 PfkB domain-containing protein [Meiothermus ruber DSM 1279]MCL6531399.1 sugar kinase [Meiothermus ruber]GAO73974.1 PfkB domain-containing protein [Meiothermus ruber H328]
MKTLDLVGLGECMVEFFTDEPLGQARTFTRSFGGDVLNALVAAARLGSATGFITLVGNDPFGPGLLQAWQAEGVDTALAPLVEGENGVYFISLLENGEREFTYRRQGSAASRLSPEHIQPAYLAGARMLLLSGITQAISPSAQAATLRAAEQARSAGLWVAFDPNYRPRLWALRGGLETARQALGEILPYVDLLLPSQPADLALWGLEHLEAPTALRVLLQYVPRVGLKAGAEGAWLGWEGQIQHVPPASPHQVRDTTGAGDAWNGAFLHGLLQGWNPLEAALQANRLAAAKLAYRGAIPPRPWPLELSDLA